MKIRKTTSLILVLVMVLSLLPFAANAATVTASGTCGENVSWTLDSEGILTISGQGAMKDYPHSASVEALHPWAVYEEDITSIVIEDGVTYIGNCAFCGCINATEVSIASSVTAIGEGVFGECTSLTHVTIPDSVTEIGYSLFKGCTGLKSVMLSKNLDIINLRMFDNCDSLTSFTVPGNIKEISSSAFMDCDNLISITLPEGLQSIGESVFSGCAKLDEVVIPKSVTSVGMNAFDGCYGMMNMAFAGDAPYIGANAFFGTIANIYYTAGNETWTDDIKQNYGGTLVWIGVEDPGNMDFDSNSGTCGSNTTWKLEAGTLTISGSGEMESDPWRGKAEEITKVVIESGVTHVSSGAFYGCPNLKNVSLPSGLNSIGSLAFGECTGLTEIVIPESVIEIGQRAFDGCINLKKVNLPSGLTVIAYRIFFHCTNLGNVTIPSGVTEIGSGAFNGCKAITKITIPEKVEKIEDYAFAYCISLTAIKFEGPRPDFDGNFIFEDVTATYSYPADQKGWENPCPHFNCNLTLKPYCSGKHTNTDGTVVKEPTCSEPGQVDCKCSVCGKEYTVEITDGDHTYDNGVITKSATCVSEGIMTYTCTECGVTKEESIMMTDHSYDDGEISSPPTCSSSGLMRYTCTVCGTAYSEDIAPTGEHTFDEGTVTTEATCDQAGERTYRCTQCGGFRTEVIAPLGHEYGIPVYVSEIQCHVSECGVCGTTEKESCTFDAGTVVREATMEKFGIIEFTCTVCGGSYESETVYRVFGAGRSETAIAAAEELKAVLGVEKFDSIILAGGEGFADALAGSYLAVQKDAPILLVRASTIELNKNYVLDNLTEGGTVYILGGPAAVPQEMEDALAGLNVVRLQGDDRFLTNLKILEEAGIDDEEILICTGWEFADSLSASATGLPILMLNTSKNELTAEQEAFLEKYADNEFTIIGGTAAVSEKLEADVEAIAGDADRVFGSTREETSVKVAKRYFSVPDYAVVAYSRNFPDGLCGGPLAHALKSPLLLVNTKQETPAAEYIASQGITQGFILGGTAAVSEESAQKVFFGN